MTISPYVIELVLHFHGTPAPWPHEDAPVYREVVPQLQELGIIEPRNGIGGYQTTAQGKFWVEMLCSTPFPVSRFVDPRNHKPSESRMTLGYALDNLDREEMLKALDPEHPKRYCSRQTRKKRK